MCGCRKSHCLLSNRCRLAPRRRRRSVKAVTRCNGGASGLNACREFKCTSFAHYKCLSPPRTPPGTILPDDCVTRTILAAVFLFDFAAQLLLNLFFDWPLHTALVSPPLFAERCSLFSAIPFCRFALLCDSLCEQLRLIYQSAPCAPSVLFFSHAVEKSSNAWLAC